MGLSPLLAVYVQRKNNIEMIHINVSVFTICSFSPFLIASSTQRI
jgi:hypothetical protein